MEIIKRSAVYVPAPPRMEKVAEIKGKHSLEDWYIYTRSGSSGLTTDTYVTPPSCLRMTVGWDMNYAPFHMRICHLPETFDILQGMMVTWMKGPDRGDYNGYSSSSIGHSPAGGGIPSIGVDLPSTIDWKKYRFLWWNSWDVSNNPVLSYRLDKLEGGEWVKGAVAAGARQRLVADGTNKTWLRVATWLYSPPLTWYFDEVELWRAAE